MTHDNEHKPEAGFTLVELLIVVAIISVIAAIAVPGLMRSRMTGNESSAIATLRVTTSSQIAYAAACGQGAFADGYVTLGAPPPSGPAFVPPELAVAAPIKSGFGFSLVPSAMVGGGVAPLDCNGTPTVAGFFATAVPEDPGTTGSRAFAVNTTMTIWQNTLAAVPPTELQMAGPPGGGVSPVAPIQ